MWLDAAAGVAGDMVCGALVDAGASLEVMQAGIDSVVPGSVRLAAPTVTRAGLRARKFIVDVLEEDPPHRTWAEIRSLLERSGLPGPITQSAESVFARLAAAEGRVHGVSADQVSFHEVGGLDSIADVVGCCMAIDQLGVTLVTAGVMALGNGVAATRHGDLPVPVPAVLELVRGWRVTAGGEGELATPTGAAIVTALSACCTDLPDMTVRAVGIGAGTRDTPHRPNVVRVVVGSTAASASPSTSTEVMLETNVDDLDPRVWPGVLARLLELGASDAWLTPILMKKGRPAHTLSVLAPVALAVTLRHAVLLETSSFGVREAHVAKHAADRTWVEVSLGRDRVRVKVALDGNRVLHATPEFEDIARVAATRSRPLRDVLEEAVAAVTTHGLVPGAPAP